MPNSFTKSVAAGIIQITADSATPSAVFTGDTKIHIEEDTGTLYFMNNDDTKIWKIDTNLYEDLTFSIASFSDGISDTTQLIGDGEWEGAEDITFTASYNNPPGGLSATVAMSGASNTWDSNLTLASATGATVNTEVVNYPSSATGSVVFTLTPSAGGSDTETVYFKNTIRRGNSALSIGNQTKASIEALTEESGPDETVAANTFNNIPTTANYLVFAYAERLAQVKQVQCNFRADPDAGQITCAFNTNRELVTPIYQNDSALDAIENSAEFEEAFEAITSKDTGLANGIKDFYFINNTTVLNYIWYGISTQDGTYSEANVEALSTHTASNTAGRSFSVTAGSGEYIVYALPERLGTVAFTVGGFEGGFESPQALDIVNEGGFQEEYRVYRSGSPNLGSTTVVVT